MDLKETHNIQATRHPWETARLSALRRILHPGLFEGITVIDVGCGDGYISMGLFDHLRRKEITAVDINLSDEWIRELTKKSPGIHYQKEMPSEGSYDLIMLLDVIEHVESDKEFLADLVNRYMPANGRIMITVPAFQSIYGIHDVSLGHYRRYNLRELTALTTACGLAAVSSGYLFSSLLLPKYVLYKLLKTSKGAEGVGDWNGGKGVTSVIEGIFNFENSLLIAASRLGITFPGLTGWMLCEKRG